MKTDIYRTSIFYLLKIYIPVYLIASFVFYAIIDLVFPPTLIHYLVIVLWTILTIIYLVYGYLNSFYSFTKHEIVHQKGKHTLHYSFKDIVYIDEKYSSKKNHIRFVTSQGDERFLLHDKKRIIYSKMLDKTPDRLTKEDANRRFPGLKL